MCGINGFNFSDRGKIKRMNQAIQHRGPDDEGIYVDSQVSLGNVRLSILDLSSAGHMPMQSDDGRYVITYNGEVYNFKALRISLKKKGYRFRSTTDTEVVLKLYQAYGVNAFTKLNGMFALAIWDKKKRELVLARDRVGIKPLYYCWRDQILVFSSELKGLLTHPIAKDIDPLTLATYLQLLYVPGELTMLKAVKKLLPGHYLILRQKQITIAPYWSPSIGLTKATKSELQSSIRSILEQSVKQQLVADRPVGIFLSGGMDSTTILAMARQLSHKKIKTFSIGFEIDIQTQKYNADFELAKRSAAYFQTDHHAVMISPTQALAAFPKAITALDEPIANPNQIPIYLLAELARKDVVVALGGDGGDELFGGYDRYGEAQLLSLYQQWIPKKVRTLVTDPLLAIGLGRNDDFLKRLKLTDPMQKYAIFMTEAPQPIQSLLKHRPQANIEDSLLRLKTTYPSYYDEFAMTDFLNWLPNESLAKTDKLTMAHGLEHRVPFLDNELIDLGFSIPWHFKLGQRWRKKIFRESVADLVPDYILKAKKRGFFTPAAKWLRHPDWQKCVTAVLAKSQVRSHDLWDWQAGEQMVKAHIDGSSYNLNLIWALLTFQQWYQEIQS